ncbi:MAG: DUF2520 domain-containing protein [Muribaculaceae bacterium]|nr:DUF2520 domain-containing protein [Muribaculaceae bacterium]
MKIVIIGSGNLATHLSAALHGAGEEILQVCSRTLEHAQALAERLGCQAICSLEGIATDADAYIIAIKDDAIADVASQIAPRIKHGVVMHTAGSVPIEVFKGTAKRYGVLYPMQTFSKKREVDFRSVPCFIEASDGESLKLINALAGSVCDKVLEVDSSKRKRLHLAAVFANNFTNHCYRLAERILQEENLDFNLFLPLIEETAKKVKDMKPKDAQTGPMVRYDVNIMGQQMQMLTDERMKEIYRLMADSIHTDYTQE